MRMVFHQKNTICFKDLIRVVKGLEEVSHGVDFDDVEMQPSGEEGFLPPTKTKPISYS